MSVTDLKGATCGDGKLLDAEADLGSILELVPNEVAAVLKDPGTLARLMETLMRASAAI